MRTPLKYAGSKDKLFDEIKRYLPENTNVVVEPFSGSGAFSFKSELPFYLLDSQPELINFWKVLSQKPNELVETIKSLASTKNKEYFIKIRNLDREEAFKDYTDVYKAARYYYIVYSGYNTGYRVNKKNQCNIDWGGDTRQFSLDFSRLFSASQYLKDNCLGIHHRQFDDFSIIESLLLKGKKPFVLLDPPYVDGDDGKKVYREYSSDKIDNKFYLRLLAFMEKLNENNVPFLMTNTYCSYITDMFGEYIIHKIPTKYSVAATEGKHAVKFEAFVSSHGSFS